MPQDSIPTQHDRPDQSPARQWRASRSFLVSVAVAAAAFGSLSAAQPVNAPAKGADPLSGVLADAIPENGSELVDLRVLLAPRVMFPDYPAVIAVVFDIEPGWHLYWKNSGDTGMPIRLSFTLPEGIETGDIYWPGPKRYPQPGDLLDYIYEDQVVLFVPLVGSGPNRATIEVGVKAEWLVCNEACLPGEATVETTLVASTKVSADEERMLDQHLSRLPLSLMSRAQLAWEGTTLVIDSNGARGMTFFPENDRNARPVNILRDGDTPGNRLEIPFRETVRQSGGVKGVLEIRNNMGRSAFYEVDFAPPR